MAHYIEVDAEDYKKGLKAISKLDLIANYLNRSRQTSGNAIRILMDMPLVECKEAKDDI